LGAGLVGSAAPLAPARRVEDPAAEPGCAGWRLLRPRCPVEATADDLGADARPGRRLCGVLAGTDESGPERLRVAWPEGPFDPLPGGISPPDLSCLCPVVRPLGSRGGLLRGHRGRTRPGLHGPAPARGDPPQSRADGPAAPHRGLQEPGPARLD